MSHVCLVWERGFHTRTYTPNVHGCAGLRQQNMSLCVFWPHARVCRFEGAMKRELVTLLMLTGASIIRLTYAICVYVSMYVCMYVCAYVFEF
jgi:hypothetical protein